MKILPRLAAVLAAAAIATPAFACGLMHQTSADAKTPAPAQAQTAQKTQKPQVQRQSQPKAAVAQKTAQPAKKVAQN